MACFDCRRCELLPVVVYLAETKNFIRILSIHSDLRPNHFIVPGRDSAHEVADGDKWGMGHMTCAGQTAFIADASGSMDPWPDTGRKSLQGRDMTVFAKRLERRPSQFHIGRLTGRSALPDACDARGLQPSRQPITVW